MYIYIYIYFVVKKRRGRKGLEMKKLFKELSVVDGQAVVLINRHKQYKVVIGGADGHAVSGYGLNPGRGEQVVPFRDAVGGEQYTVNMREVHKQAVSVRCESYEGLP